MAKGSGGTRRIIKSSFALDVNDYDSVVQDAQKIFKEEAKKGLGKNFMNHLPVKVSNTEYQKLLESGEYLELYHGGSDLNGTYYLNNDLHAAGFGYYFTPSSNNALSYADKYASKNVESVLVKKSDIYDTKGRNEKELREKGLKTILKNKYEKIPTDYRKDYYDRSTIAARLGYKAARATGENVVVIDRSILIIKKK